MSLLPADGLYRVPVHSMIEDFEEEEKAADAGSHTTASIAVHNLNTSEIAKLPSSEQITGINHRKARLGVTVEISFQNPTIALLSHRVAISYKSPACIAG